MTSVDLQVETGFHSSPIASGTRVAAALLGALFAARPSSRRPPRLSLSRVAPAPRLEVTPDRTVPSRSCRTRRASIRARWTAPPIPATTSTLRVRRLAEEQSDSGGPDALGRVRQAVASTTSATCGAFSKTRRRPSPSARPRSRRSATTSPRAWTPTPSRRRASRRCRRTSSASRAARPASDRRAAWETCISAFEQRPVLRRRRRAGRAGCHQGRSRASTAGGLGLPDRDYYVKTMRSPSRTRSATSRTSRSMFELLGEPHRRGEGGCGHGDAHRDRARESVAHEGGAARSAQGLSPRDAGAHCRRWRPASTGLRTSRPWA